MPDLFSGIYLIHAFADAVLLYLIFFRLIYWDRDRYKFEFWVQVLVYAVLSGYWSIFDPFSDLRLWITIAVQFAVAAAVMPSRRWRALAGIVSIKMFELLILLIVTFFRSLTIDAGEMTLFSIEFIFLLLSLTLAVKMAVWVLIRKSGFRLFRNIPVDADLRIDDTQEKNKYLWVILFVILTSTALFLIAWKNGFVVNRGELFLVFLAETAFFLLIFVWMQQAEARKLLLLKEEQLDYQNKQIEQIQTLFNVLRSERHDFVNHTHVLQGLVRNKSYEQLEQYLKQLSSEVRMMNQVLIKDDPLLSAILQVKMAQCSREGIELDIKVYEPLYDANWKCTEMITLIGNIMSNAIEAFRTVAPFQQIATRKIWFETKMHSDGRICLTIGNNGLPIGPEMLGQVRQEGFSSKPGHSGIGLASVERILEAIGGEMQISSNEKEGTVFTILIPKGVRMAAGTSI